MANPYHSARQVRSLLIDHGGSVEVVFVECISCPTTESTEARGMTDAQAEAYFRARGWSIKPTRCPLCAPLFPAPPPGV